MKKAFYLMVIMVGVFACQSTDCNCEEEDEIEEEVVVDETEYDSLYAEELGADEYGMKSYVMAFLKTGPNNDLDSATAAEVQIGHMENINAMAEEGKLVLAGPFFGDDEMRGIYIFDATMEEAEELTKTDPAVQAGVFIMELYPWYGSATLLEINDLHKKAAKIYI